MLTQGCTGGEDTRVVNDDGVLTIGRLRSLLQGIPDDYIVYSEGCDCVDNAGGIDINDIDRIVTVERLLGW